VRQSAGTAVRGVACGASLALLVAGCSSQPSRGYVEEGFTKGALDGLACGPLLIICVPAGIVLGLAAGATAEGLHDLYDSARSSSPTPESPQTYVIHGVTFTRNTSWQVFVTGISSGSTTLQLGDLVTHCNDNRDIRLTRTTDVEKCMKESGAYEFRVYRGGEHTTAQMQLLKPNVP
jgi:hypothetical protein